jgi:hypothetical protein
MVKTVSMKNFRRIRMKPSSNEKLLVCGREFTQQEIKQIHQIMATNPAITRTALSREVCDVLHWFRPNGQRKDMACRVALRRLENMGLISLPQPTRANGNGNWIPQITNASEPREVIDEPAGLLEPLRLLVVTPGKNARLWNELIHRYHYLGYRPLVGAQLRYLIYCERGLLAALSFSASAWKIAPRDHWIGWSDEQRQQNLQLIVGNSRFLILPWVNSRNLASKILALAARQFADDWQQKHGYKPVLLETFVEQKRFSGSCYKAAGWIHVGQTQGRGKLDRYSQNWLPLKDIFVFPLCADFRQRLCSTKKETQS